MMPDTGAACVGGQEEISEKGVFAQKSAGTNATGS